MFHNKELKKFRNIEIIYRQNLSKVWLRTIVLFYDLAMEEIWFHSAQNVNIAYFLKHAHTYFTTFSQ